MIQKIQKNVNYKVISSTRLMSRQDAEEFLSSSNTNFIKLCDDLDRVIKIMYTKSGTNPIWITSIRGRSVDGNDVIQSIQNGTVGLISQSSQVHDTWFEEFRPENHRATPRYVKKLCTFPKDAPLLSSLLEIK